MTTAERSLIPLVRRRLGRVPVPARSARPGLRVVGAELHEALDGGSMSLCFTMYARDTEFEFDVGCQHVTHSGRWFARSRTAANLTGAVLSNGLRVVQSDRRSATVEQGFAQLRFVRTGLTTVTAFRKDGEEPIAVFRSVPLPSAKGSFVAMSPTATHDEVTICAVALASGVVLLLRPFSRIGVVHWPFAWQRPVPPWARSSRQRRFRAEN